MITTVGMFAKNDKLFFDFEATAEFSHLRSLF